MDLIASIKNLSNEESKSTRFEDRNKGLDNVKTARYFYINEIKIDPERNKV